MVINECLEYGYKNYKVRDKLRIIRHWVKTQPMCHVLFDFTCISPINPTLKKRFHENDELGNILMFCNHYLWYKMDLDMNCTGYVKRRIINSKFEKAMLHGTLSKDEYLTILTNLKTNIDLAHKTLLDEELPF